MVTWFCPVVQWTVHWAPSRTTRILILAGARHCALETCGKKMQAPLLGLAKSLYYCKEKLCLGHLVKELRSAITQRGEREKNVIENDGGSN